MDFSSSEYEFRSLISNVSGENSSSNDRYWDPVKTTVVKTYGRRDRVVFSDKLLEAHSLQNRNIFNNSNEDSQADFSIDPFDRLLNSKNTDFKDSNGGPKKKSLSKKMKLRAQEFCELHSDENELERCVSPLPRKRCEPKKLKEIDIKKPELDSRFHQNWSDIENTELIVEVTSPKKKKSSEANKSKRKQSRVDETMDITMKTNEISSKKQEKPHSSKTKQKVSISSDFLELELLDKLKTKNRNLQITSTPNMQYENGTKPSLCLTGISPFPIYKRKNVKSPEVDQTPQLKKSRNNVKDCAVMITRLNYSQIEKMSGTSPRKKTQTLDNLCQTFEKMSTRSAKLSRNFQFLLESDLSDVTEESEESDKQTNIKNKEKSDKVNNTKRLYSNVLLQQQLKRTLSPDFVTIFNASRKVSRLTLPSDKTRKIIGKETFHRRTTLLAALTPHDCSISGKSVCGSNNVLMYCGQEKPIAFTAFLRNYSNIKKIDEGSYGEVFTATNRQNEEIVLKIQAICDDEENKFDANWPEVVCSCRLGELRLNGENATENFIYVNKIACLKGIFPKTLLELWDEYDQKYGSESERPNFSSWQMYLGYEIENGGTKLETYQFSSMTQAVSIFLQIAAALAAAENVLEFEHRDLHWGNILVKATNETYIPFTLNGETMKIKSHKIKTTIIDFGLSRLKEDCAIFVELDKQDLMSGDGDYQFDIYRKMWKLIGDDWESFYPKTNIMWLHYLVDKLLKAKRYTSRSRAHILAMEQLNQWDNEILSYDSANNFVASNLHLFSS